VPSNPDIRPVIGDLRDSATYADVLSPSTVVLHLAAATGKVRAAECNSVNVDGTASLLDACRKKGVRRFVFVSSIAATYADTAHYPYAASKQRAEALVRASGLDYLIVRPTIILGKDSPIWKSLAGLAGLPVVPVFGDGRVRVQPIHVDDVAKYLAIISGAALPNAAVDLGGRDVMTFEELLRRIARSLSGRDKRVIHVPVHAVMALLGAVEPWLWALLPITAGQLSAFVNDSVAHANGHPPASAVDLKSIDEMLALITANG
jgi:NADH dehydrogenase